MQKLQVGQHLRQLAACLAGADQVAEHTAEHLEVLGRCLRQGLPALDAFDQAGDHLAKTRMLDQVQRRSVSPSRMGTPARVSCSRWKQKLISSGRGTPRRPEQALVLDRMAGDQIRFMP